MRGGMALALALLLAAGCLGGPDDAGAEEPAADGLAPIDPQVIDGELGRGAEVPLATSALVPAYGHTLADVEVHPDARSFTVHLTASDVAVAFLRDADGTLLCAVRSGRVCAGLVQTEGPTTWRLDVTSLSPAGGTFTAAFGQDRQAPALADDGLPEAGIPVFRSEARGGEPTLAWTPDGRIVVAPTGEVYRLEADGTFTDVTPPAEDAIGGANLDPFLAGDPVTGRIYLSQLVQCLRVSWTDDGGDRWTTNPLACAGPEQHHQKMAIGRGPSAGPVGFRAVHIATMNLASWLTTDELVIVHTRSFDGGLTWTQNPSMVKQVAGMEARAVGNIAVTGDGTLAVVAYLCDRFVDAEYGGVGVGVSDNNGLTWTWRRIAEGGGRCEGIDPGIAAVGETLYAAWEDISDGVGRVWWSTSTDHGVTWSPRQAVPTGALGSFVFTDAAASSDRLVLAFHATADTTLGPTQAPGWARWYPYLASLDLANGTWTVGRLQGDPVQVGPICMDGPKCLDGARNLLDFIDVQLSADGRAAVAYADGCDEECDAPWESRGSELRVARED